MVDILPGKCAWTCAEMLMIRMSQNALSFFDQRDSFSNCDLKMNTKGLALQSSLPSHKVREGGCTEMLLKRGLIAPVGLIQS